MYEYHARLEQVVDGDTQDLIVDLGFHIQRQIRVRLLGVDTHEIYGVDHNTEEYRRGKAESEFAEQWFQTARQEFDGDWPLTIQTEKKGKYGRYLTTIRRRSDGDNLTIALKNEFDGVNA